MERRPATTAQLEYARELILELGYDLDWYALERMSRGQAARLIDKLLGDLQGGVKDGR